MLDIVFFPFSHISRSQLNTLLTIFSSFRCLPLVSRLDPDHPLAPMVEQGRVKPEFHSPEVLSLVDRQVRSFRDWAGMHKGNEKNLKSMLRDTPYFTDDSDLTRIQSQLRERVSKDSGQGLDREQKSGRDLLLFLKFAGILDLENERIDDELKDLEKNRGALFSQLKGAEQDESPPEPSGLVVTERDPGQVMTDSRIRSWCRVAMEKKIFQNREDSILLVTTSPAVFDRLYPGSQDLINGLDIESIKVHEDGCSLRQKWQSDISEILEQGVRDRGFAGKDLPGSADGCRISAQIKLGIFPEKASFLDLTDFNLAGKNIGVCLVRLNPHKKT
ncbi:hypothetical protein [Desulfospira joergensenii]|uniref:hypothetical protein n=1 Tax=Desulfospira joergensenii TaxID=53329 RepID=UPI0003B36B08|nr:hypothetical protein [Desulfospira joergensenii]